MGTVMVSGAVLVMRWAILVGCYLVDETALHLE